LCATKKLIVLDEPTNGLDPSIAKQIYDLLDTLKKNVGITILMVSHDIERALSYADSVIEISNGEVVFTGSPSKFKIGGAK
jgi:ABC-type multidrug transport system ATPase subunit